MKLKKLSYKRGECSLEKHKRGFKIRILLVKTSSLGDIVHTLPALTDAMRAIPGIVFDWVIEEKFQTIPKWHPAVNRVIPIQLRQWKKQGSKNLFKMIGAIKKFKHILNEKEYDLVIDAQGLLKSALITLLVKAPNAGYQSHCIREKYASFFYRYRYDVPWNQHAVERVRQLFSQALYYPMPANKADYHVDKKQWEKVISEPYVLLFHGTTWANKHWPENYWKILTKLLNRHQMKVKISWGNQEEYARSRCIAQGNDAEVLPELDIQDLMPIIANACAVIAVDTGLCHLAAALNIPTIALFGPTDPEKTGILGEKQVNLAANFPCAPCLKRECHFKGKNNRLISDEEWPVCFTTLPPALVMKHLIDMKVI